MRSIVLNRKMLADERGLFLSLPTSLLYKFKDDITDTINLTIIGKCAFTANDPIFKVAIDGRGHNIITDDTESQLVKQITLYSKIL